MTTICTIARKEWRETWRDGRVRVVTALVWLLAAAAMAAGWQQATRVAAEHAEAQRATREQWVNQPAKNPHSAAHYGIYAFRPQSPLAAVDPGVDPYVGVAAWLEAHRQNEFRFRPAADRADVQRFGDLTGAFVLQTLLPLVVIMLAFGSVAGEREAGTLRQVLSVGVSPVRLMMGKVAGVSAVLAVAVVPAVIAGGLAIRWAHVTRVWDHDMGRTAVLMAVYLAWALLWVVLALVVSVWARTTRTALVVLLAIWMGWVIVAPRLASEVAARLYATPSAVAFERAIDEDLADRTALDRQLDQRRREAYAAHGVSSDADLPFAFAGISLQESEEHANVVYDRHFGRLHETFERQNAVTRLAGVVVPSLAVRALSMGLAGTDFAHHRCSSSRSRSTCWPPTASAARSR
ncbi:MAG: hypothetical protein ABS36_18190 [Acidobacteria bacterium SCN 69-37]|nr:MAG: hypothetical protein ABS36_18190 [Acidobacteria bacterium SCN 69-37]